MTRKKRSKFLDPKEIETAINEIAMLCNKEGVNVALIGGIAMQIYGSRRLTFDVDLVASNILQGLEIKKSLTFGGVKTTTSSGVPVDLVIRDDDYKELYEEALKEAIFFEDIAVPVVSPEYLAAMKLAARRAIDEEDLRQLIKNEVLDIEKTRHIIRTHLGRFAVDEFNSYVFEVEWRRKAGLDTEEE